MRSVSWRSRVVAAALVVMLLVPTAVASDSSTGSEPGLWAEFVAWLNGDAADEDGFTVWLMIRIHIPNG